jgi:hypothetical protein
MADSYAVFYTGYIVLAVGLLASNMICKVIVSTVTKKQINPIQMEMGVAIVFPLLIRMAPFIILKQIIAVLFLLVATMYSGLYAYQIVNRIAKLLGIKVLTV